MSDRMAFANKTGALLLARLNAFLDERGISHPRDLLPSERDKIFRRALAEMAAVSFAEIGHKNPGRGPRSYAHAAFFPALERVRSSFERDTGAFARASGVDAAVVLAGYGLPVAPYNCTAPLIFEEPSNDIDTVIDLFSSSKSEIVGYNVCAAPFFVLLTDCVQTLREQAFLHPELSDVKKLFERRGASWPPDPGRSFQHGMALFARRPGDMFSTARRKDRDSRAASIELFAGWQVDGEPHGAPDDGHRPVPMQLLHAVAFDPLVSAWLVRPVGTRVIYPSSG
jgi:hypothetical protein